MTSDKYKECADDLERLGMTPGFPPLDKAVCAVGASYIRELITEINRLRNFASKVLIRLPMVTLTPQGNREMDRNREVLHELYEAARRIVGERND